MSFSIHDGMCDTECDVTYGHSCYLLHCVVINSYNDFISWTIVNNECVDTGGHLASFTSQEEFDSVKELALDQGSSNCQYYFIGLKRNAGESRGVPGNWKWTSGEERNPSDSSWLIWEGTEPNGADSTAAGVFISFDSGNALMRELPQDDTFDGSIRGYICEMSFEQTTVMTTEVPNTSVGISSTMDILNVTFTDKTTTGYQSLIDGTTTDIVTRTVGQTTGVFETSSSQLRTTPDVGNLSSSPDSSTTDTNSVLTDGPAIMTTTSINTNSPDAISSNRMTSVTSKNIDELDIQLQRITKEEQKFMSEFLKQPKSPFQVSSDSCDVVVYSVYWKTDSFDQPVNISDSGIGVYYMVSGLLSYTLYVGPDYTPLSSDITLTYKHSSETLSSFTLKDNDQAVRVCSFWNESQSLFSMDGCTTVDETVDHVICYCNHTTNFAMLVQITENEPSGVHEVVLNYITIIGLSISLLALLITLSVYIFLWELWNCLRNNIHKNLVACMIVFNALFIFGANHTEDTGSCRAIAIFLHYSLLCMFTWMAAEAVYILDKVVRKTSSKWNKLCYYMIVCYTIPAIIVTITIASSLNNYATDKICWLNVANGAIFAFLVPMYLILLFNILVTLKAANVIYERSKGKVSSHPLESSSGGQTQIKKKTKEQLDSRSAGNGIKAMHKKETQQLKKALRGMLFLIPIFGLTWMFALFAFDSDRLFFQYMFAITNSLQGVSISIVYCLQDNKTMDALNRRTGRMKRLNDVKSFDKTESTHM
ncbi:adhesion G protein-coupled receptor E3-like isoform X2 [Anneissia japonica]|uniref:adhesion G protein-coupled receptor E3-like isoform X2 n=1 Tax=Anneissia japonica TaxID=1529436 RepID=UPI001425999B|nr:adhesion G protein-coupled receptor E3-like isoform X2 [Anneissia japonica]